MGVKLYVIVVLGAFLRLLERLDVRLLPCVGAVCVVSSVNACLPNASDCHVLCAVWVPAASVNELLVCLVGTAEALSGAMEFAFTSQDVCTEIYI